MDLEELWSIELQRELLVRIIMPRSVLTLLIAVCAPATARGQWVAQQSGTEDRLRGLCVVSRDVAWASGTGGSVVQTADGGKTWRLRSVAGASDLDFRDIEAVDARNAWVLSIGPGPLSRIYQTSDGGETWSLRHTNRDPNGFLDAIALWPDGHGLALGDPVGGRFTILATEDHGKTWNPLPNAGTPVALPGEGAFAASGTCLITHGERDAWFASGGANVARVFHLTDRGRTWNVVETPVRAGNPSAGIFSLAFRDERHGVAVGGDFKLPTEKGKNVALTSDGGRTWRRAKGPEPGGYRSAVTYVTPAAAPTLIAVGPTGSDISVDDGESWSPLGDAGFHAIAAAKGEGTAWAVGERGTIARWQASGR
jgi:photosystem II stability/assembly factor-like uncharacterized protein